MLILINLINFLFIIFVYNFLLTSTFDDGD